MRASAAARRAASRDFAITANSGWPPERNLDLRRTAARRHDGRYVVFSRNVGGRNDRDDLRRLAHLGQVQFTNGAARRRRPAERHMQRILRFENIVDIVGAQPCTCLRALSCGSGLCTWRSAVSGMSSSCMDGRPARVNARRVAGRAGDFGKRLEDQIAGDAQPVGGTGAHVGERREVRGDAVGRAAPRGADRQAAGRAVSPPRLARAWEFPPCRRTRLWRRRSARPRP